MTKPLHAHQVRFGNSIEVVAADAVTNPEGKTILQLDLNQYAGDKVLEPGAWALTFQTIVQEEAAPPSVNPLVAKLSYGSGGAFATAFVSISPGSVLQVSADQVRADVILEQLINGPAAALPVRQLVRAFLRRGYVQSVPVRAFHISTVAAGLSVTRAVPPLSVDVFVHGNDAAPNNCYAADAFLSITGGASVLALYSGTDLRNAQLSGNPLPVPAGTTEWSMLAGVNPINGPFSVEFGLDL